MIDPEAVRERRQALQDPDALAELQARCEAAVVLERTVGYSPWAYLPRPFPRQMAGEEPARGPSPLRAQLGVDADGRPVLQRLEGEVRQLFDWADGRCDVVESSELTRYGFAGGRLVEEVEVDGMTRLDGRLGVTVTRWSYDDAGRPSFALETYESGAHRSWGGAERGPYWRAKASTFTYDADGELATIATALGAVDFADGGDHEAAQAEAAAGFPSAFQDPTPTFDARTQAVETDLPDPDRAYEGLAEPLAEALFAAIDARRDELGPLELVLVGARGLTQAAAADATFVDRARSMGIGLREALGVLWSEPRGSVLVDAVDTAPPDTLRRIRAGQQAGATQAAVDTLVHELTAALDARTWPGVVPTFLVLSRPPDEADTWRGDDAWDADEAEDWDEDDWDDEPAAPSPLAHLEPIVGRDRADALVARFGPARKPESRQVRPADRRALADILEQAGLGSDEAGAIAADALWGIVLEPGGAGVSRLGGAPVLPVGTAWPTADERPLTHLAMIALDELPDVEGREHLPASGTLSFFADLSDEGEFYEPIEPDDEAGRDLVAVVHAGAGAASEERRPPGPALSELRVRPAARLQVRSLGWGEGRELGLDALAEHAVLALTGPINGPLHAQLLGYPQPVQEDPREPGQIVLFQIGHGSGTDFELADGGDLQFLGTPADVRAGRWDQLTVWPSSG